MRNTEHLPTFAPVVSSMSDVKQQITQEYQDKLQRLDSAAALLEQPMDGNGYIAEQNEDTMKPKRTTRKRNDGNGKQTFGAAIQGILSNGNPLTSAQLRTEYNKIHAKKFDAKNFSARLSNLNGKENSQIARTKIGTKSYYGLIAWFAGKKLKPEYLTRIALEMEEEVKGSQVSNHNQRAQMNN